MEPSWEPATNLHFETLELTKDINSTFPSPLHLQQPGKPKFMVTQNAFTFNSFNSEKMQVNPTETQLVKFTEEKHACLSSQHIAGM